MVRQERLGDAAPLPPATFQILLALVDGERHGYAIMKEVAEQTDGAGRLGPGTLYGTLKRLLDAGRVEAARQLELKKRADAKREEARRAEARRLEAMRRVARVKKLLGLKPA